MKKLVILSAIAMSGLIYNTATAQIGLQVGFHFGHPRVYASAPVLVEQAPVYNQGYYDNNSDYYYLPDVDAYYSVNEQCYYYFDGDNWIAAAYLPGEYRAYDWRNARRFEIRGPRPYMHNDFYREKYNGRVVADWGHGGYDNRFKGGYNHDDHFDRGFRGNDNRFNDRGYRGDGDRFNDRSRNNGFEQRLDNRAPLRFNQNQRPDNNGGQHFDNHQQGGGYNQPAQPNRDQNNGGQHFDNHQQGGNAQPSNQNDNRGHDNRGGNEHFSQTNQRGDMNHRMSMF